MTGSLVGLSLAELRDGLRRRAFSAVEVTRAYNKAVGEAAPLNAYIRPTPEEALRMAAESDSRLATGSARPLDGVPIAVKDLFCTQGIETTAASRMLAGFRPPYESTVTEKLWQAGAVLLGKTNLDEFAMGSSTTTSCYGPTLNPWRCEAAGRASDNRPLVPGGSSGGSAAAVAAQAAAAAIGTDTGGSIRQPASFCGIVGLKPSYGRCSRWGVVAFASSLDHPGPMTRTVRDAAILLGAMAGHDPRDSTSAPLPVPDYTAALTGDIRGLRIGIPREYRAPGMNAAVEALWQRAAGWLQAAGAEIIDDLSLPHTKYALPAYYIIAPAEASSNLARYDGVRFGLRVAGDSLEAMYERTRAAGFGAEVRRRILIGTYVLSAGYYEAYYVKAQRVRTLIAGDFAQAFERVDCLLTPTAPTAAFAAGEISNPVEMYLNDVFTVPANLAGLPAISVPAGLSESGLPLGLQLTGRAFDEATVLRVAEVLERTAQFRHRPAFLAGEGR